MQELGDLSQLEHSSHFKQSSLSTKHKPLKDRLPLQDFFPFVTGLLLIGLCWITEELASLEYHFLGASNLYAEWPIISLSQDQSALAYHTG